MKFGRLVLIVGAVAAATAILIYHSQPEESTSISEGAATVPPEEAAPRSFTDTQTLSQFPMESGAVPLVPGEPLPSVPAAESLQELVSEDSEVEWEKAPVHPALDDARLSESQRQAVQSSPVPVLLPDQDELLNTALISIGDYFYAASMDEEGVSVLVTGASRVVRVPGTPDPPSFGDHELTLSRSEGIVDLSFKAYGVYYDVSIECFDPFDDPRCAQDAYMLDVADGLLLAAADNARRETGGRK